MSDRRAVASSLRERALRAYKQKCRADTLGLDGVGAREQGWYEVDDDGFVRAYWWDGHGWRFGPDGVGPLVDENGEDLRITRLVPRA